MINPTEPTDDERDIKREMLMSYLSRQIETGKWLLASLLVVNGGAIIGLISSEKMPSAAIVQSARYFITGLGLAFAAGIFAWGVADGWAAILRVQLKIFMTESEEIASSPKLVEGLTQAMSVLAFFSMIGSLAFFAYGALAAADAMAVQPPANSISPAITND